MLAMVRVGGKWNQSARGEAYFFSFLLCKTKKIKKEKIHLPFHINTTKCDLTCCLPPPHFPFSSLPPFYFQRSWVMPPGFWMYISFCLSLSCLITDFPVIFLAHLTQSYWIPVLAGFINAPIHFSFLPLHLLPPPCIFCIPPLCPMIVLLSSLAIFLHLVKYSCWSLLIGDFWLVLPIFPLSACIAFCCSSWFQALAPS